MVFVWLAVVPAAAYAQASITGTVRDTSGAVLPGVTVEAASPALIEKVRSVVTDGTGQYRIENLRPGAYTVTFMLPGFSTVRREGIEMTGTFTATVNAELRVGALEETVTVTGETPIVDVQSATTQRVFDKEMMDALPLVRHPGAMPALLTATVVAPNSQQVGGTGGSGTGGIPSMSVHGLGDMRIFVSGLSVQSGAGGTGDQAVSNLGTYQEVVMDVSSISAEQKEGGIRMTLIPRAGGNTFSGSFSGAFANNAMQGSNFTQDLKDRGLRAPDSLKKIWDINPAFGGPIIRDKLWFHMAASYTGQVTYANIFHNKNIDNPNAWTYEPDLAKGPATKDNLWRNGVARITWEATPKNKLAFAYDQTASCGCPRTLTATRARESEGDSTLDPKRLVFAEWTAPVTNRLLVEASTLQSVERGGRWLRNPFLPNSPPHSMIQVLEQSNNLTYRAAGNDTNSWNTTFFVRGVLSYITGAHAFKMGFNDYRSAQEQYNYAIDAPISFRFNNGVPNRLTLRASTRGVTRIPADVGLFAQERWTVNRLTVTAGLRYDYFHTVYPSVTLEPDRFVPTRNIVIPEADGVRWHEIEPRTGLVLDLFGTGKTALKFSLNKYLGFRAARDVFNALRPSARLINSTNRSWNDANRNFTPDCDLLTPTSNGECGAMDNPDFGSIRPGVTYDPEWMRGLNKGDSNWEFSAGVQHELFPRVSLDVGYYRRWLGNFLVTDDRAVSPSDYDPFSITAPVDPRLPGGGGYVISGLYDLKPQAFGRASSQFVTLASNYGKRIEHWNGVDVTLTARPRTGVLLSGGVSTGRRLTDDCDLVTKVDNPSPLYCRSKEAFRTQVKVLGSFTIPRMDVQVSGTLQNLAGAEIVANYVATNAVVSPSLGRNLAGGASNVTVSLFEPGTMYGDRINQLDLRIGKIFRFGNIRTTPSLDVFNLLNANPVLSYSNAFATWQRPQQILNARFVKVSVQFDF
jgi:hypothetical protein